MRQSRLGKWCIRVLVTFVILLGILATSFFVYTSDYYHGGTKAQAALQSDLQTTVTELEDQILFVPHASNLATGLIFYPGAKVEATAYAPLMKALADEGYFCALIKMPYHLAFLDSNAADRVLAAHPEIENWYLGGHSLGGAIASSYVSDQASLFKGLILLASYSSADLSHSNLKVLSLYGSEDQVLNMTSYTEMQDHLPVDTIENCLEGGNHAGFGDYGPQEGDGIATISPEKQQALTTEALTTFMKP